MARGADLESGDGLLLRCHCGVVPQGGMIGQVLARAVVVLSDCLLLLHAELVVLIVLPLIILTGYHAS